MRAGLVNMAAVMPMPVALCAAMSVDAAAETRNAVTEHGSNHPDDRGHAILADEMTDCFGLTRQRGSGHDRTAADKERA